MSTLTNMIYSQALYTHNLSQDDINYAVNILSKRGIDYSLLIHLIKNEYIGMFSFIFNELIDSLIKGRKLDHLPINLNNTDLWPEVYNNNKLTSNYKNKLIELEGIYRIALVNCINFATLNNSNDLFLQKGLYNYCLENLFLEAKLELPKTIIETFIETEFGVVVKIKRIKYFNILDLIIKLSQDLTNNYIDLKNGLAKELILNDYYQEYRIK